MTAASDPRARPRLVRASDAAAVLALVAVLGSGGAAAAAAPIAGLATTSSAAVLSGTGDDALGQQGNGADGSRLTPGPVDVTALPDLVAVASGRDHGYALGSDGSVIGWGANDKGQLGDGTLIGRPSPVRVGVDGVVAVESGHYHGIALRQDGTVRTWGYGATGQIGDGSTVTRRAPVLVPGLGGVTMVAAGRDTSYALRADGTVLGWGDNTHGQVGDGTTVQRTTPTPVTGLTGVVEIAAGRDHALAVDSTGRVWAWGDNLYGQVGDGSTADRSTPVLVHPGPVAHVDAGAHHSIAVTTDGTVLTWGRGYRGQLGTGGTSMRTRPGPVLGLPPAVEVGDGRDTSFAVTAGGEVWGWGDNASGQIGDGTTLQRMTPVQVPGLTGVDVVQGGALHTFFFSVGAGPATPPTATFQDSCDGLACSFTSTAADPDGSIVASTWSLGDGTTSDLPIVQHTYAASGSYLVRLTVVDDTGATASTERTVTVTSGTAPQIEPAGAAGSAANTLTAQVLLPPTVQPGDQLVLFLTTNRAATTAGPAVGGSWSLVRTATAPTGDMRTFVWARDAVPGDAGRAVQVRLDARSKHVFSAVAYRGAELSLSAAETGSLRTSVHRTPLVFGATTGSVVLSYWSDKSSATTDWSGPTTAVDRAELFTAGSGRVTSLLADGGPTAVGEVGGLDATANSASAKAIMVTVVLAPAG